MCLSKHHYIPPLLFLWFLFKMFIIVLLDDGQLSMSDAAGKEVIEFRRQLKFLFDKAGKKERTYQIINNRTSFHHISLRLN